MARIIPLPVDTHEAVQRLLPWHVIGQLEPAETAFVETHLAGCAICEADLRSEQRLKAGVCAMSTTVEGDWARLRKRIEVTPRAAVAPGGITKVARRVTTPRVSWLGWAIAAQFLIIVLLGQQMVSHLQSTTYRTLAAPPSAGSRMIVIFRPETPEGTLRAIVNSIDARLVDGPTSDGAYVVQTRAAHGKAVLAKLRAQAAVVEAESLGASDPR